ncbi:hypothetical protein [Methylorubrum sp. SL192]|uniref:hypothetical protein n=1 Tax=Methylorubrum sp. SL192 TaxID=2995167 RepID=UPI00227506F9|nr:hypothetical protein [Methylorubrum sp. SL192]MCY1644382.1 hypothetical protein [Methylorubrum sp. SL192]
MNVVLHDSLAAYEREYNLVRGALTSKGTSLNAWLSEQGINRQLAYRALKGQSLGRKAVAVRAQILRDVLGSAA